MKKYFLAAVAEGFGGFVVEVMKGKGIKAVAFKGSAKEAVGNLLQRKMPEAINN